MLTIFRISILLLLLLFVISCHEEEDINRPVITILEPAPNKVLHLPDTLKVVADVLDDINVTAVELRIVDENGAQILSGGFFYPDTSRFRLTAILPVEDRSITSGTYQLKITASDGIHTSNAFLPLVIHEITRTLAGYMAFTAYSPFETTVSRYSTLLERDTSMIVQKRFYSAAVHGLWEQFFLVTKEPSVIYSFSVRHFEHQWEFHAELPRPAFTAAVADADFLVATANGDAVIFGYDGRIITRTLPQQDRSIQCFAADDSYLYAELVSLSGAVREMACFYRITGAVRAQKTVAGDIVSILPMTDGVLVLAFSGTECLIYKFDPKELILNDLNSFGAGEVLSALKISEEEVLVLTDRGITLYNYTLNILAEYLQDSYLFGRYDDLDDLLYMAHESSMDIYDASSVTYLRSVSFDEPLLDFHLIYNK